MLGRHPARHKRASRVAGPSPLWLSRGIRGHRLRGDSVRSHRLPPWSLAAPLSTCALLAAAHFGLVSPGQPVFFLACAAALVAGVFAAVHHAETLQLRIGEAPGVVLLALSVTVIEVSLITSVMLRAPTGTETIARDAVFAAIMVVVNGVVGLSLVIGGFRHHQQSFQLQGTASALAVLGTLAVIAMILPAYTVTAPTRTYAPVQLWFVGVSSLLLYAAYLAAQIGWQRDYFVSPVSVADGVRPRVSGRNAIAAGLLLVATLASVALLADALTPSVQQVVLGAGLPQEVVGVIIAVLVLLPEGSSAVRAARADRLQSSLNYALGSAIASSGLTIPAVALTSASLGLPIDLGLAPEHIVLLGLTLFAATLTLSTGRTTMLQGVIHIVIFLVFLLIAAVP